MVQTLRRPEWPIGPSSRSGAHVAISGRFYGGARVGPPCSSLGVASVTLEVVLMLPAVHSIESLALASSSHMAATDNAAARPPAVVRCPGSTNSKV